MAEKITFPATETYKIGRITYKVSAHFDEKYDHIKPKIEKMLRSEIETAVIKNKHGQISETA